ncbi:MAG: FapA family protein [Planctomycetes bacterium]|nr:FapA family protein [Planctomycetota bacterium]
MATVHRAVQETLDREVALKLVLPEVAADEAFRKRFIAEARAMARINHPNVVTCYDAGITDGRYWMALELVTGGDLLDLLERRPDGLKESLCLTLMRDCLLGLEAIEQAGLIHRDIKPANIFLTERGQAKLADLGLARSQGGTGNTVAGMIMGTPAYMSPEQAQGGDLDIRSDLFSIGATLFHLLTGRTPWLGDTPIALLMKMLKDPVPDPKGIRADLSPGMRDLVLLLLDKERAQRPKSSAEARVLVERLLAGDAPRPAAAAPARPTPAPLGSTTTAPARAAPPSTERTRRIQSVTAPGAPTDPAAPAAARPDTTPISQSLIPEAPLNSPLGKLDPESTRRLMKRIQISADGLRAALVLAPGASFPLILLEHLLDLCAISYGRIERAMLDATRPCNLPRRICLARGDAPTPDREGRTIKGEVVPRLQEAIVVRVSDDGMVASAIFRTDAPIPRSEVEQAVRGAGVTTGVDAKLLLRLINGPMPPGGKLEIARGTPPVHAFAGGFALSTPAVGDLARAGGTAAGAVGNLQPVAVGEIIALWREAVEGRPGIDVRGRPVPFDRPGERTPDACAGDGVEVVRTGDGDLALRALRAGVVHLQPDGRVDVVGVLEIIGDVGPESPPIDTDDLVLVRGNIKSGAQIASRSDVVVLGDLQDASIDAGGNIEVQGGIARGDKPLVSGGTVTAGGGGDLRRIVAAAIRISGTARDCELVATGDVVAGRIVGGSLTAGGSVTAESLGDSEGTPTMVWAGHCLGFSEQAKVLKAQEARIERDRERMLVRQKALAAEVDSTAQRNQRLERSQYVKESVRKESEQRLQALAAAHKLLAEQSEEVRRQLADSRRQREDMQQRGENPKAKLDVHTVAFDGTTVRVADAAPVILKEPRLRLHLDIT